MHKVSFRKADVEGLNIFYREAGPTDAQTLLLLHGFQRRLRESQPELESDYRVSGARASCASR